MDKDKDKEVVVVAVKKQPFIKPCMDEIKAYALEIKATCEPANFFDHFESNGWKVGGKTPMKDWRAAFRKWNRNNFGAPRPATMPIPAPMLPANGVCRIIAHYGRLKGVLADSASKDEDIRYINANQPLIAYATDLLAMSKNDSNAAVDYLERYNRKMEARGKTDWALSWALREAKEMGI